MQQTLISWWGGERFSVAGDRGLRPMTYALGAASWFIIGKRALDFEDHRPWDRRPRAAGRSSQIDLTCNEVRDQARLT